MEAHWALAIDNIMEPPFVGAVHGLELNPVERKLAERSSEADWSTEFLHKLELSKPI